MARTQARGADGSAGSGAVAVGEPAGRAREPVPRPERATAGASAAPAQRLRCDLGWGRGGLHASRGGNSPAHDHNNRPRGRQRSSAGHGAAVRFFPHGVCTACRLPWQACGSRGVGWRGVARRDAWPAARPGRGPGARLRGEGPGAWGRACMLVLCMLASNPHAAISRGHTLPPALTPSCNPCLMARGTEALLRLCMVRLCPPLAWLGGRSALACTPPFPAHACAQSKPVRGSVREVTGRQTAPGKAGLFQLQNTLAGHTTTLRYSNCKVGSNHAAQAWHAR